MGDKRLDVPLSASSMAVVPRAQSGLGAQSVVSVVAAVAEKVADKTVAVVDEAAACYRLRCVVRRPAAPFRDVLMGRLMVQCLREMDAAGLTHTCCFVVMPDDVDWLFTLRGGTTLAGLVCRVRSAASERVPGLRWCRGENVQQHGAHALRDVARHMVSRPLREGLVKTVGDYALWDACWLEVDDDVKR